MVRKTIVQAAPARNMTTERMREDEFSLRPSSIFLSRQHCQKIRCKHQLEDETEQNRKLEMLLSKCFKTRTRWAGIVDATV